jgi:hypothetical protein
MAENYLPGGDAELIAWTNGFLAYVSNDPAALGITINDVLSVSTPASAFVGAFDANVTAQNGAKAAAQAKDAARATTETAIRALVRRIQANPNVTNAQRQAMGISLRGTGRTPVDTPTTRPVLQVDTSQALRHTILFHDEATPTSKAKPAGVMGCEIHVQIGGAKPSGPNGMQFLGLDTRTPYLAIYPQEDGGKMAYYLARWVNTKGESGPWSEMAIATIGGL